MTATLGLSVTVVGVIDGIAEATSSIVKVFSGYLSDRFGKRKPLILLGYGLAAALKPLFPLAAGMFPCSARALPTGSARGCAVRRATR